LMPGLNYIAMPEINNDIRMTGALQQKKFRDVLMRMIDSVEPEVLVLDPLISYHGEDENDNAAMRRSLDHLTEIQDITGVTTIVAHHLGKQADKAFNAVFSGRGASAIGDWAANILTLSLEKKEGPEAIIKAIHHKARNFPTVPDFFMRRTKFLEFELADNPNDKNQKDLEAVIHALSGFEDYQAESQAELVKEIMSLPGYSKDKAKRAIWAATKTQYVVSTPHPEKKKQSCYSLTFDGQLLISELDADKFMRGL